MKVSFDLPTVFFLLWVVVLLPVFGWQGYQRVKQGKPLRSKVRRFSLATLVLTACTWAALMAADANQIPLSFRTSSVEVVGAFVIATALLTAVSNAKKRAKPADLERTRRLYAPETTGEWLWAMLLSLCAGFGEEIMYRGVLYGVLLRLTGDLGLALTGCVVLFGLSHLPQAKGAFAVALLGLIFHILYLGSGSLVMPIIVHTTYDVVFLSMLYRTQRKQAAVMAKATTGNASPA